MKSATPIGFRSQTTGAMTPFMWGHKHYHASGLLVFWIKDGEIRQSEADEVEIWSDLGRVVRPGPMLMAEAKKALCCDARMEARARALYAQ